MSDDNDTLRLSGDDGSLAGDALLHAVRQDMQGLFGLVKGLDQKVEAVDAKVEALDAKVEARLRDTTPMWEVVVSRLDTIVAEQGSHGRRLDAIEGRLEAIEGRLEAIEVKLERLDPIEGEIRQLGRRIERMIGELSHDVVALRAAQHDIEDRIEKLEKTPA